MFRLFTKFKAEKYLELKHMTNFKNITIQREYASYLFPFDGEYYFSGNFEDKDGKVYRLYIGENFKDNYYRKYFEENINDLLSELMESSKLNIEISERSGYGENPHYSLSAQNYYRTCFEKFMQHNLVEVDFDVTLEEDADFNNTLDELLDFGIKLKEAGFYYGVSIEYGGNHVGFGYKSYNEIETSEELETKIRNALERVFEE